MGKLWKYIKDKRKYIAIMIVTIIVCSVALAYPIIYEDISNSVNALLAVTAIYAIYHLIFNTNTRKQYIYLTACVMLMAIFVNRLYSYKQIVALLPGIRKADINKWIVIGSAIVVAILVAAKLLQMGSGVKSNSEKEKNSQPDIGKPLLYEMKKTAEQLTDFSEGDDANKPELDSNWENKETTTQLAAKNTSAHTYIHGLEVIGVMATLIMISGYLSYLSFSFSENWLDFSDYDLFQVITTLFLYGLMLMTVILALSGGILILLWVSKYILKSFHLILSEWKNDNKDGKMPTYVLSVFIVLAILYISQPFENSTIEGFVEAAAEGEYLTYPLFVLLGLAVFVVLLWLIHIMLVLVGMVTGDKVRKAFENIESRIKLASNCKIIVTALFEFLFSTILSIFSFLNIIPDYITSMAELVGIEVIAYDKGEREKEKTMSK